MSPDQLDAAEVDARRAVSPAPAPGDLWEELDEPDRQEWAAVTAVTDDQVVVYLTGRGPASMPAPDFRITYWLVSRGRPHLRSAS